MDLTVDERVQNGIARFDALAPLDWRDRISLSYLSMSSTVYCVGGQVFGSTDAALNALCLDEHPYILDIVAETTDNPAYRCGILYLKDDDSSELTEAWKQALAAEGVKP